MVRVGTRTHPWLASDVARTWVLVLICVPVAVWLDDVVPVAFAGVDRAALEEAAIFLAWAVFAILWSIVTVALFGRADSATLHRWLARTTPVAGWRRVFWSIGGGGGIYWAVTGSLVAIVALATIGATDDEASRPVLMVTGLIVVIASIALTIVAHAVRYAREAAVSGGLTFPDTPHPVLADYIYLSAHLSISLGGADVVVGSTRMRRLVTAHSVVAYAYNAIVLGLLVSVLIEVFA
jgi:hypothetical protein